MRETTETAASPAWSAQTSEARQLLAQALRLLGDITSDTALLAATEAAPKIRRAHQLIGGDG